MSVLLTTEGDGIRRTFAQGLPVCDGPLTVIYWTYIESFGSNWASYWSIGPNPFSGADYIISATEITTNKWALGLDGFDFLGPVPSTGQWYAQAVQRKFVTDHYEQTFYYDLPTVANKIEKLDTEQASDITLGATHELSFGRNPWQVAEWANARFAGIKIFEQYLTEAQIIAEIARPELVNGGLTPWAIVPAPTIDDVTDISGNGRHFSVIGTGLTTAADPPFAEGAKMLFQSGVMTPVAPGYL